MSDQQPAKRGRGRPRKNPEAVPASKVKREKPEAKPEAELPVVAAVLPQPKPQPQLQFQDAQPVTSSGDLLQAWQEQRDREQKKVESLVEVLRGYLALKGHQVVVDAFACLEQVIEARVKAEGAVERLALIAKLGPFVARFTETPGQNHSGA